MKTIIEKTVKGFENAIISENEESWFVDRRTGLVDLLNVLLGEVSRFTVFPPFPESQSASTSRVSDKK